MTIYFDCVNWFGLSTDSCLFEINGNITKYNIAQRINGYTIEVDDDHWYVYVAASLCLSGFGGKTQAFHAMVNYLRRSNGNN